MTTRKKYKYGIIIEILIIMDRKIMVTVVLTNINIDNNINIVTIWELIWRIDININMYYNVNIDQEDTKNIKKLNNKDGRIQWRYS